MLGLSLADLLGLPAAAAGRAPRPASAARGGFGTAKSVIMVYLQGGPSHLDLWDPKDNVPDNIRSVFKPISTKHPRRAVHRGAAEARQGRSTRRR